MGGFSEVLKSVCKEWQGFAVRVSLKVFVAHRHCDCFEEEIVLFRFFVDFFTEFIENADNIVSV